MNRLCHMLCCILSPLRHGTLCRDLVLTLLLLGTLPAYAAAGTHESESEGVDVLHHIADSYEWHITRLAGRDLTIPLPVILHDERGWHCFSSERLHAEGGYEGFYVTHEGAYAGKIVRRAADGSEYRPLDLSFTKSAAGVVVNSVVVLLLILGAARWYRGRDVTREAPKGLAGLVEMLVESLLNDIIRPCVGANYRRFAPYLLTAFFFIFVNNLMGLIPIFPGGANVTGNISVTFVLAVATFLAVNIFGSKHYWKEILWPEVPTWLKAPVPIMPFIELIGIFTKPFALMIRLFANIMAGHSVLLILTSIIFATAQLGAAINGTMSVVAVLLSIFMTCLELLVAFIQAYVFTMLSAVFIGLAQEGGHDHETENV